MQVLNVPTPAYLADEEFSIFRESVGRFLDDNAPPEKSDSWRKAKVVERDLWTKAAHLPGVTVSRDRGGVEAARFHVRTSGEALLYAAGGELLYEVASPSRAGMPAITRGAVRLPRW